MSEPAEPSPRLSPFAVTSLVLGLSSALGLLAITGLPALYCGLRGLRAVNASDGRVRGRRLAVAGMALGGLGTVVTAVGGCAIGFIRLQESSRRVECADQMRQVGIALNKYATASGTFPPATRDPAAAAPERRISWLADVLPLLAEGRPVNSSYQALEKSIDRTQAWDNAANEAPRETTVRAFLCRGHPDYRLRPVTHYVGLAGVGEGAATLPREAPAAGVFGHDRGVAPREFQGGISYTMVVIETARDNGPWLAGGPPTVRGLERGEGHYCGPGRAFGGMHHRVTNVLWGDGSVRPVSDDTPGELMRRQVTLRRVDGTGGK